ncbi:hypothetical protein F5Y04DRAFT_283772 [Hypomontagnella monticulosa]|nr:hypothetical protein F5Y04DRAFT_283772 [Hypomontagnella monticulosa]
MSLVLEIVEDEKDFDQILPLLYIGFSNPPSPFRKWFMPIHTTLEAAIEDAKCRSIKKWRENKTITWIKVTDIQAGKIIGAASWDIREEMLEEPQMPANAYWHREGSEEKAFAEKLLTELRTFTMERMSRPHVELQQLFVHPNHRKMGAGRLLVNWGKQIADELGLESCIEAVPFAVPAYERFGYGNVEELNPNLDIPNPSAKWKKYAADDSRVFLMWRPAGRDYRAGEDRAPWLTA